ncbi:MAG: phage tail tube protein [Planctomycetota bacterium]
MSVKGHSTTIAYGDDATYADSSGFTEFANVTGITPPKAEADDIDVTHMTSPEQWKEYEAGWADGGEVEFTVQFDKSQTSAVFGLFRQNKGYEITFSDGSTWGITGYIKAFGDEIDREGIVTTTLTIKVSGKPAFSPAAAA